MPFKESVLYSYETVIRGNITVKLQTRCDYQH